MQNSNGYLEAELPDEIAITTIDQINTLQDELFDCILMPQAHIIDTMVNCMGFAFKHLHPGGLIVFHSMLNVSDDDELPTLHAIGDCLAQNGFNDPVVEKYERRWEFSSTAMRDNQLKNAGLYSDGQSLHTSLYFAVAHAYKQKQQSNLPISRGLRRPE